MTSSLRRMTPADLCVGDLRLLQLVALAGSIGRAADRADLSQPHVSRRLGALERVTGLVLLERGKAGSSLTPAGRVLLERSAPVLSAIDRLVEAVEGLRHQVAPVRVGVSMTIAEEHAPRWWEAWRTGGLDGALDLTVHNSGSVCDALLDGRLDLGFIEAPVVSEAFQSWQFGADELVVAVAPRHPWAGRIGGVSAAELAEAGVLVRERGSGTRETLDRALDLADLVLRPGLELASPTALRAAAVAGIAPVVLSARSLRDDLRRRLLIRIPVLGLDLVRPLSAVWLRGRELGAAERRLLALVQGARHVPGDIGGGG